MAKQNVSQSIIHTVTVQMTVKVNSEFYVQGHSVKAISLLDSQLCFSVQETGGGVEKST